MVKGETPDSGTPRDSKGTPTGLQRVSGGSLGSEGLQWDSGGTPEGLRQDSRGTPRDSEGLESAVSPLGPPQGAAVLLAKL